MLGWAGGEALIWGMLPAPPMPHQQGEHFGKEKQDRKVKTKKERNLKLDQKKNVSLE